MIFLNKYPSIKLDSGIRIVNYSSPHTYKFHTGEELPACSDEVAQDTKLEAHHSKVYNDNGWLDVSINYALSELQYKELPKLATLDIVEVLCFESITAELDTQLAKIVVGPEPSYLTFLKQRYCVSVPFEVLPVKVKE